MVCVIYMLTGTVWVHLRGKAGKTVRVVTPEVGFSDTRWEVMLPGIEPGALGWRGEGSRVGRQLMAVCGWSSVLVLPVARGSSGVRTWCSLELELQA